MKITRTARHQNRIDRFRQQIGIVERIVQAAAFLAVKRAADDQFGALQQVAQLDQVGRHPEMAVIFTDLTRQHLDAVLRALQPLGRADVADIVPHEARSEEHTSELQSLMRTSYAVFCLNKTYVAPLLHTTHYHI